MAISFAPRDFVFPCFAIVELFGHEPVAGYVSEHAVGCDMFFLVDVFRDESSCYTKLYGTGAIYSITATTEELAREFAKQYGAPPVIAVRHEKLEVI